MNASKAKGTKFEVAVAEYLDAQLPVHVERRALRGTRDTGDIAGIEGVVCELKCCKAMDLGVWMNEAEREADRDGGSLPVVIHKRRGKGDAGESYATLPIWALAELLRSFLAYDPLRDPFVLRPGAAS